MDRSSAETASIPATRASNRRLSQNDDPFERAAESTAYAQPATPVYAKPSPGFAPAARTGNAQVTMIAGLIGAFLVLLSGIVNWIRGQLL